MSRKKKRSTRHNRAKQTVAKQGPIWHQTAEEATLAKMPKYNAFGCGTGAHGDAKYNRARQKQAWRNELRTNQHSEGLRNRGGLPLCVHQAAFAASGVTYALPSRMSKLVFMPSEISSRRDSVSAACAPVAKSGMPYVSSRYNGVATTFWMPSWVISKFKTIDSCVWSYFCQNTQLPCA